MPQPRTRPPRRRRRPDFARRRRNALAGALAFLVVIVVAIVILTSGSKPVTGFDVSFPQCTTSLPSNPLFGIVGVNGGLAKNYNPCLANELKWAQGSPGQKLPHQARLALYINTGNPGQQSSVWPKKGTAPAYGKCDGQLTNACSYLYGEQRAEASYRHAAADAATAASSAAWWLDVEEASSWAKTYQLNISALEGFIAGLHTAGATGPVGIYSTAAQWHDLTGLTNATTKTAFNGGLPDWVASIDTSAAAATQNCSTGGFTGETPTLAQYLLKRQDADVRCGGTR